MLPLLPLLMLGGAGAGELLNKKDPLKGALMGTALGAGGGLLAPAMGIGAAGAAAEGAATAGMAGTAASAAPAALPFGEAVGTRGMGMSVAPQSAAWYSGANAPASNGLLGTLKEYKPVMDAAGTGLKVGQSLTQKQQPIQAPQAPMAQGGNQTLSQLYQQGQSYLEPLQQAELQRQQRRMQMVGR